MPILKSATKVVLIILVITLCYGTLAGIIDEKTFDFAISSCFAFYFGQKSIPDTGANQPTTTETTTTTKSVPNEKVV
jgi:hypothetical protein